MVPRLSAACSDVARKSGTMMGAVSKIKEARNNLFIKVSLLIKVLTTGFLDIFYCGP